MNFFTDIGEITVLTQSNYIEFQTAKATKDFDAASSLYMTDDVCQRIRFHDFIWHCAQKDILFDGNRIEKEDWAAMLSEAARFDEDTHAAMKELHAWLEAQWGEGNTAVTLIRESDRVQECRKAEDNDYPMEVVQALNKYLSLS